MLQSEVINKLAKELSLAQGTFDYFKINRTYIQMALTVGIEHFHKKAEEIVVLDKDGVEAGRFKSSYEAEKVLGIDRRHISAVINGLQHTAGGLMFIRTRDYELIKRDTNDVEEV